MPYLQANLKINNESILSIAKVPNRMMQMIIDIKVMAAKNCEPIFISFDNKKLLLSINGFIFQLSKP